MKKTETSLFQDGEKICTLRGEDIATQFIALVENYVDNRFGDGTDGTPSSTPAQAG